MHWRLRLLLHPAYHVRSLVYSNPSVSDSDSIFYWRLPTRATAYTMPLLSLVAVAVVKLKKKRREEEGREETTHN